jgi:hypothetical protein
VSDPATGLSLSLSVPFEDTADPRRSPSLQPAAEPFDPTPAGSVQLRAIENTTSARPAHGLLLHAPMTEVTAGDPNGLVGPQQIMSFAGQHQQQPAETDRPPTILTNFDPVRGVGQVVVLGDDGEPFSPMIFRVSTVEGLAQEEPTAVIDAWVTVSVRCPMCGRRRPHRSW